MKSLPNILKCAKIVIATACLTTVTPGHAHPDYAQPVVQNKLGEVFDQARSYQVRSRNVDQGKKKSHWIIQNGDLLYGSLLYGYNSDDNTQMPIYATLHVYEFSTKRLLHGARLLGQLNYTKESATINFTQMTLLDGRTIPVSAIAVSANLKRMGIAGKVNYHTVERYGALLVASLLRGVGQVGNKLLDQRQSQKDQIVININGGKSERKNTESALSITKQIALASVLPVGEALTTAAQAGFNRPPTISAPAGFGIGVVFLQPINRVDL